MDAKELAEKHQWTVGNETGQYFMLNAKELQAMIDEVRQEQYTQVAQLLLPDPCDERPGFYLSLTDSKRLETLPPHTVLYIRLDLADRMDAAGTPPEEINAVPDNFGMWGSEEPKEKKK